jgi:nucleotide-binding universal stress UspA family protein
VCVQHDGSTEAQVTRLTVRPKRLIVPLDGSKSADRIIPAVRYLARSLSVPVSILHVFSDVKNMSRVALDDVEWTENAEPRAHIHPPASLRESCALLEDAGVEIEVVGRVGSAAVEIAREAQHNDGSWIMIASQGEGGIRRLFMGSTATSVVRTSSAPVIMVPSTIDNREFEASRNGTSPLVSVFLDGTPQSETAVEPAAAIASALNGTLDVVRVAETMRDSQDRPTPDDDRWEAPALEQVRAYLERLTERCVSEYGLEVNAVSLSGSPGVQLLAYADSARPGLVALATRKRSGIERWTYGSLGERLVDRLQTPLLLIPVDA